MKRKPFNKKLALHKQTVAKLNSNSLHSLKGGSNIVCLSKTQTTGVSFGGFDVHRQFNTDCLYATSKHCNISQFTTSITNHRTEVEFTFTYGH